ncbi:MAG: D-alanine--D-alanine ligase family protein [candidate division WOR-3 bacterium]
MRIGISYDLFDPSLAENGPPDLYEEWDQEVTIKAIASAIEQLGHEPLLLGGGRGFLERVLSDPPDLVFNIAEGYGTRSREAHIPAILEFLGIPYTGSDPLTLALTLDKEMTKIVAASAGVRVPASKTAESIAELETIDFPLPAILKLRWEGSSMGLRRNSKVKTKEEMLSVGRWLLETYNRPIMIEEFIPGKEITVAVVGNGRDARIYASLLIEHISSPPENFVYSIEVKHNWRDEIRYTANPAMDEAAMKELESSALAAYSVLGCRDVSRLDFRFGSDGHPYFIEVNPLPGLNPTHSDLWIMTDQLGIPYHKLIGDILGAALKRLGIA